MQEVVRQFGDKCPTERPIGSRGCGEIPYFHGQIQSPRSCHLIDAQFPGRLPKHSARVAAFPPARHSTGFKHNYTLGCQVRSTNSIGGEGVNSASLPRRGLGVSTGSRWWNVSGTQGIPQTECSLALIRRGAVSLHLIFKPHLLLFRPSAATHRGKKILLSTLRILSPILLGCSSISV